MWGLQYQGLFSVNIPKFFALYYAPSLITTLSMFVMTGFKCGRSIYINRLTDPRLTMPMTSLLLRDGVFWFLAVFLAAFPQLAICLFARPTLTQLMIGPSLAMYSIIAARGLLSLRKAASQWSADDTLQHTTLVFAKQNAVDRRKGTAS